MSSHRKPIIGYLLKTFPKLSETFILNEILELERQGLNLHIFSLRPPQDTYNHPAVTQINAPITYIPSMLPQSDPQVEQVLLEARQELMQSNQAGNWEEATEFHTCRSEEKELNELWQAGYLAREIQRLGITHLHVHFANIPTATAELVQKICGISYSITAHAKDIYLTQPEALDRRMTKAEFVLTCTDFNRKHLSKLSTSDTPIYLAYHGIDLTRFTLERSSLTKSARSPSQAQPVPIRLLSIGRFCEKKGFYYLLNACCFLRAKGLPFTCTIVGYGPMQDRIEQWIHDYQLDGVITLAGKLTQDQVVEQYRQSNVFVLPCIVTEDGDRDGIPNVLLEAMAMGLPVVSTNISGIGELVQSERNGLLVSERNIEDLAIALERLIHNPALRSRLGKAGQYTVCQKFALEQNVGEVKDYLLRALTKVSKRSRAEVKQSRREAVELKKARDGWIGGSPITAPIRLHA